MCDHDHEHRSWPGVRSGDVFGPAELMVVVSILGLLLMPGVLLADEVGVAPDRQWERIWPSEADGAARIRGKSSTGPGSPTWFKYAGAGSWKIFELTPNVPVLIRASGDSGRGAMLGHVQFRLEEVNGGARRQRLEFRGPSWRGLAPGGEPKYRYVSFTPVGRRYKVSCLSGGFYIEVYQARPGRRSGKLSEAESGRVNDLIEELGDARWSKREAAHQALIQMGPGALPLLAEAADSEDAEVRLRVEAITEALNKERPAVPEGEMAKRVNALIEELAAYVAAESFKCDAEPVTSMASAGAMALPALHRQASSKNQFVRAAALHALGRLGQDESLDVLAEALQGDEQTEVRYQAAAGLERFGGERAVEALKRASQTDESPKVRRRAAESLAAIQKRPPTPR